MCAKSNSEAISFSQILKSLGDLKHQLSDFDVFNVKSWSEVVLWQAANGTTASLLCLFQTYLVGSLYHSRIKDMIVRSAMHTDLLDNMLSDVINQKFICFNLRNSVLYNDESIFSFWLQVLSTIDSARSKELLLEKAVNYRKKDALCFVFKLMDIVETKCPFSYLKILSKNPHAYYSDSQFYAYVHSRLKNAVVSQPELNVVLKSLEKEMQYAAKSAAYLN